MALLEIRTPDGDLGAPVSVSTAKASSCGHALCFGGLVADDDPFMLHLYAALAEKERALISQRTKDALAAAKAKGVVLGKHGREVLAPQNRKAAQRRAMAVSGIIRAKIDAGKSLRIITA